MIHFLCVILYSIFSVCERNEESVLSSEREFTNFYVEKDHLEETQANEACSSGQHGKKKKRTQAKRPGYARDGKTTR
jgi:hypothetical protein